MKTITAITPQKKSPDRCNIFLDGEFFCGMSLIVVMKNRLKAGMKIDVSRIEEIQLETEKNEALDKAMTLLSSYEKTEKHFFSAPQTGGDSFSQLMLQSKRR